jgi:hypothetical protein
LKYHFKSSKRAGAILAHKGDIDVQDVLEYPSFQRCIRKNYASWLTFANDSCNHGICLLDLVLVTGFHKTSYWACAAFESSSEVTHGLTLDAGSVNIWATWGGGLSDAAWGHAGPLRPPIITDPRSDDNLHSSPDQSGEGLTDTNKSGDATKFKTLVEMGQSATKDVNRMGMHETVVFYSPRLTMG